MRLDVVPARSLVTSHAPARQGAPLYWVVGSDGSETMVRSVASGEVYAWPNDRQVDVER